MALSRDDILGAADLTPAEIEVPEWGGTVFIRPLTAGERGEWETFLSAGKGKNEDMLKVSRAMLAMLTLCDATGARLFTESDLDALMAKNATALERIAYAAMKLNKLRPKDIADLAKN